MYFSGANTVWDNATTHDWATSSAGPYTLPWSGGSIADFVSPAGTVTVSGNIASVNSLSFDVTGYALTGGNINLTGSGGSIAVVAGNAAIGSVLSGSVGLTKTGSGLLTLSGGLLNISGLSTSSGSAVFNFGGGI